MKMRIFAPLAIVAAAVATPASAVTIDLSQFGSWTGQPGYFSLTQTFVLPTNAINVVLNITNFGVDDRGILSLNGVAVDAAGIFAVNATPGSFNFSQNGPLVPYTFNANGTRNVSVSTGFLTGSNSFNFQGNDTNNGIYGQTLATAAQAGFSYDASVSYDLATGNVPEPASWALMIGGFGAVGAFARRRARVAVRYA